MYTNTISSNICRHENGILNENQISSNNSDLEPGDYDGRPLSIVTHTVKYTLQNFLIVVVMATERLQKRPQASLHTHRPLRFFQLKASSYEKRVSKWKSFSTLYSWNIKAPSFPVYTSISEMNNPWMMLKFYPIMYFLISYLLCILYTVES